MQKQGHSTTLRTAIKNTAVAFMKGEYHECAV